MKVGDLVKINSGVFHGKCGIIIYHQADTHDRIPVVQVVISGDGMQWFNAYQCEVLNESR